MKTEVHTKKTIDSILYCNYPTINNINYCDTVDPLYPEHANGIEIRSCYGEFEIRELYNYRGGNLPGKDGTEKCVRFYGKSTVFTS